MTGLSFLVSNSDTKEPIFYTEKKFATPRTPEELLLELEQFFSENKELESSLVITLIYATNVYAPVPLSLFDETKASEYLKFNSKILANDYISHDALESAGTVIVYIPFVNINNYIFDRFGSFQYYHATTVLLRSFLASEKHTRDAKVFVHVTETHFDLLVLKDGALQLCNSYSYRTPEDFVYYILFCFEQLKLNPETVPVTFFGSISEESDLFQIVYQYIRNVSVATPPATATQNLTMEESHYNYLLTLSL
ncbi:DUF3822 family protein [Altibacter sp.]|uniref:DUF3822 family protein n=1 Tax=Altibacter sp. TaxID=2024823 RepID=UPI0025845400|nr:DUF3822 family protein [Altibacter sp.]MCW9036571.1 DUF3822 family protein [Altibacter sp.]